MTATHTAPDTLRHAAQGPLAAELSSRFLEEYSLLPLRVDEDGVVIVACGRVPDETILDELARTFGRAVRTVEAPHNDVQAAIISARSADSDELSVLASSDDDLGDLRAQANDLPVVQLVNSMLGDAMRTGASDLHLESSREGLRVRMRMDGVLRDVATYALQYQSGVVSRIKLLAGLDIAERRVPQDGRARVRLNGQEVDVRVSTLPALHGESIVLRMLDHAGGARDLASLGLPLQIEESLSRVISRTSGLVLVTGPTGSGKTTTLYAALDRLNAPGVKIVTVEDPVEYQLKGITQIPVHRKAGLDFAAALRSILRHDPDVVMVGEMRDRETAEVAIQAALTGHLVFSTLHTNDAVSGITRLLDMGVAPYLVSATVQAIVAQRLVRVLCSSCRVQREDGRSWKAVGCEACAHSGFKGRTGLYELFEPNEEMRRLIVAGRPASELRSLARADGMISLSECGMELVRRGETSAQEVARVCDAGALA